MKMVRYACIMAFRLNLQHPKHLCMPIIFFSLFITGCQGVDCNELPAVFSSYEEAEEAIESASFAFEDDFKAESSSWISRGSFYSCNGSQGFLIWETEGREYIHVDVPRNVWEGFKEAESAGSYYNGYIRGQYYLSVSN